MSPQAGERIRLSGGMVKGETKTVSCYSSLIEK